MGSERGETPTGPAGLPFVGNTYRFAYFPFGGGPRRCIGDTFAKQEARLAVATITQHWTFAAETEELSLDPTLTLRPDGPVELRVHRR